MSIFNVIFIEGFFGGFSVNERGVQMFKNFHIISLLLVISEPFVPEQ